MRIFLLILILILSIQSLTKADDISDFEIEGISIGDSLLDFFNKSQISNFINYDDSPTDMKFRVSEFSETNNFKITNYDMMQVYHKPKDKKFIIHGIRGGIICDRKTICKNKQNKIIDDLKISFSNHDHAKIEKFNHPEDTSNKSFVELWFLNLKNGYIVVRYTDWSKNMNYSDNVDVEIATKEVEKWLRSNYGMN